MGGKRKFRLSLHRKNEERKKKLLKDTKARNKGIVNISAVFNLRYYLHLIVMQWILCSYIKCC